MAASSQQQDGAGDRWHLEGNRAGLRHGALEATVDLTRPDLGLHDLRLEHERIDGGLLQLPLPPTAAAVECPLEPYVRAGDLIVAYPQSAARPFRPQVYWRAAPVAVSEVLAAVELMVSVQTNLLDSLPQLQAGSLLPAGEVFRIHPGEQSQLEPLAASPDRPVVLRPDEGPLCVLVRPANPRYSVAEIMPASDFDETTVSVSDQSSVRLRHKLFAQHLEKGVILRARLRSVLLPRNRDVELAATCCRALLADSLPLTT